MPVSNTNILKLVSKKIKAPYGFQEAFSSAMDAVMTFLPAEVVRSQDARYQHAHAIAMNWLVKIRCGNYAIEVPAALIGEIFMPAIEDAELTAAMPYSLYQPANGNIISYGDLAVLQWYYGLERISVEGIHICLCLQGLHCGEAVTFSTNALVKKSGQMIFQGPDFEDEVKRVFHDIFMTTMLVNKVYHKRSKAWAMVVEREERAASGKRRKKTKKGGFLLRDTKYIQNLDSDEFPPKISYVRDVVNESEREEKRLQEALKNGDEKPESWWRQHYRLYWIHPRNKERKKSFYEASGREVIFLDDITRGECIAMVLEFKQKLPPTS